MPTETSEALKMSPAARQQLSRRAVLTAGAGITAWSILSSVLQTTRAQAYSLPVWDASCPDPFGWASARFTPHAGYYVTGTSLYGANCTNYVAWVFIARGVAESSLRGLGDAGDWASRAAGRFHVDTNPAVGSVGQIDRSSSNPYGHVTYIEAVRSDGTLEISESNWTIGGAKRWLDRRLVPIGYFNHFIHIDDGAPATPPPPPPPYGDKEMLLIMKGTSPNYSFGLFGPGFWYEWTGDGSGTANSLLLQIAGNTPGEICAVTDAEWTAIKAAAQQPQQVVVVPS